MKEYHFEYGKEFNPGILRAGRMPLESYVEAHRHLPILCHDAFIEYCGGILLVNRDNAPAKDILWGVGGRIERGMSVEESLGKKVREEVNLELSDITFLDLPRAYWETDPFSHGRGTDNLILVHFGHGHGSVELDDLHKSHVIVRPWDYTPDFRNSLHPYVMDFMDMIFEMGLLDGVSTK